MPLRLDTRSPDFPEQFRIFLATKREVSQDVAEAVAAIVEDVRTRGDAALIELSKRFDRIDLAASGIRVDRSEIAAALKAAEPEIVAALRLAHDRIHAYHSRQLPRSERYTDEIGVELGHRWTPVDAVGLYVPGGTAAYPSSVLMNAVPAKVAGVKRLAMVVPAPDGVLNPLVLAAAELAGVDEIYRIGGAQAVAALAYGTQTIPPVAKIVGPGNAYVAAAKRHVFGTVGIDMVAGPSEVLVVADGEQNPDWIAADLLAQAEHDTAAQSILMTDDDALAEAVIAAVERQLATLPRCEIAGTSWRDYGAVIRLASLEEAPALVDRVAPEHLEIMAADAEGLAERIHHAGAIFLGGHTPEAIGDYVGGSNHVLPTARSARFSSGLNVLDFMKRTSFLKCGPEQLRALGPAAVTIGTAEGLGAHARSVAIRLNL
ncbi:histidinol dehydrogenase [Ancylobacter sp. 6x-1]|uniref:Histidinol dehydrogenase n=1 Tax=Ancylobacter crimeensis TaxID=2579147 RepID=A0ABT0DFJ4_9HYPH|nr:histidinol dehydrogenase [Ancylobacter crimeensis]MCK0198639.1 histidinol dehydrogenase [Ancylobacter crimeensis]